MNINSQLSDYEKINELLNEREASFVRWEESLQNNQKELLAMEEELLQRKREQEEKESHLRASMEELSQARTELERLKQEVSEALGALAKKEINVQELQNERLRLAWEKDQFYREQKRAQLGCCSPEQERETQEPSAGGKSEPEIALLIEQLSASQEENARLRQALAEARKGSAPDETGAAGRDACGGEGRKEHPAAVKESGACAANEPGAGRDEAQDAVEQEAGPVQEGAPQEAVKAEAKETLVGRLGLLALQAMPELTVLPSDDQSFLAQVGDKQLQFLAGDPLLARICTPRKASLQLSSGIRQLNRMQKDWTFSYAQGELSCSMPFVSSQPPQSVVEKCQEALTRYFK